MKDLKDLYEFGYDAASELPILYRSVLFCMSKGIGRDYGADCCGVSPDVYARMEKRLKLWGEYISYYHEHKDEIDVLLKKKLIVRKREKQRNYNIFNRLLLNPFVSPSELGRELGIKGSTVRTALSRCRKQLSNEKIMEPIMVRLDKVVFKVPKYCQDDILLLAEAAINRKKYGTNNGSIG